MLRVDLDSAEPIFAQVVRGVREAIARREVKVGDRLPSVRQLAGDLGIHPNTVARAYRQMEDEGLVRVRHGQGATVIGDRVASPVGGARGVLERTIRTAMAEARLSGLSDGEIATCMRRVLGGGLKARSEVTA